MSLETRIDDDWKAAMKAGDKARKDALSLLRAAIKQKRVDDKVEITDAVVVSVIEKMLKQRKDSIAQYEAAQRQDLADAEKFEAGVLAGYMPQGLSAAEVEAIVAAAVAESGAKGAGRHGQGHRAGQAQGRRSRRHGRGVEAGQGQAGQRLMRGIMPA
jgi:uncharacterized protein YqeY